MPQSDQENNKGTLPVSNASQAVDAEAGDNNATPRHTTESNKSWSSTIMTLLSGSRNTQDLNDVNNESDKIDEELTW
jgi:hypothetical protein